MLCVHIVCITKPLKIKAWCKKMYAPHAMQLLQQCAFPSQPVNLFLKRDSLAKNQPKKHLLNPGFLHLSLNQNARLTRMLCVHVLCITKPLKIKAWDQKNDALLTQCSFCSNALFLLSLSTIFFKRDSLAINSRINAHLLNPGFLYLSLNETAGISTMLCVHVVCITKHLKNQGMKSKNGALLTQCSFCSHAFFLLSLKDLTLL